VSRTQYEHPADGPVAMLITGSGSAQIEIFVDPNVRRATANAEPSGEVEFTGQGSTLKVKLPSGGSMNSFSSDGDVSIVQRGGSTTVVATGRGAIVVGNMRIVSGGGNVFVGGSDGVQVTLRVPPGSSLDADVGSADIAATGVLVSAGASAKSGDIRLDQVAGQADLRTGSGDITVAGVATITARTGSGDITVDDVSTSAELRTGSGDIRVSSTSQSCPVRAKTGSGDVTSRGQGIRLDASTGSGSVRQRP
jgi:hypothetical protein